MRKLCISHVSIVSFFSVTSLMSFGLWAQPPVSASSTLKQADFVDVRTVDPSILVEARYATDWNFMGRTVAGYRKAKCLLARPAAEALARVQKDLDSRGLSLLAFDCYRPQEAVDAFVEWTKDSDDPTQQKIFYPDEPKATLISRGYIASRSGHSRGATVDLTIVQKSASTKKTFLEKITDCRQTAGIASTGQLDMGTTFDCFSVKAHHAAKDISAEAQKNRQLLKSAMEKQGFAAYAKEWWHYTLKNEPYPKTFFEFEVE